MNEYELYHFGVKGMKWGVRKDRKKSSEHNADYSNKQRKHDQSLYGERAEKRINKRMNKGYGIQAARHYEVTRKERIEKTKHAIKKGLKATGSALATIGSAYIYDQAFNDGRGTEAVKKVINTMGRLAISAVVKARGGYDIHWYDK